jgi:hypothetical protein
VSRKKDAFAVVIALGIMSFILVLLLSLTLLARVEFQSAETGKQRLLARENARLALMIALGDLQRYAGPDQRVTARAEILQSGDFHNSKRHYTGVWDEDGNPIRWLVSGEDALTVEAEGSNYVKLVSDDSAGTSTDRHVSAAIEPIEQGTNSSGFAFFVSDESQKASLGKQNGILRRLQNPSEFNLTSLEAKRLSQGTAGRARVETIFPALREEVGNDPSVNHWDPNDPPTLDSLSELVAKAQTLKNLDLIEELTEESSGGRGRGAGGIEFLKTVFHDVTYLSTGLLTNTVDGGLKLDLSDDGLSDSESPFPLNQDFKDFLAQRTNADDHAEFKGVNFSAARGRGQTASYSDGDPINTTPLVLTEFALYIGVFRESQSSDNFEVGLAVRADVWNPYATNLGFTPRDEDDFLISIEGLPEITVDWETERGTDGSESGSFAVDLSTFDFSKNGGPSTTFSIEEIPYDIFDKMAVGEVRTVVERLSAPIPGATFTDSNRGSFQSDFVSLSAPPANLTIRITELGGGSSNPATIQQIVNLNFDSINTNSTRDYTLKSNRDRPSYGTDYSAVYHFKFEDDILLGDLERWGAKLDPRSIEFDLNGSTTSDLFFVNEDPAFAAVASDKFMNRPEFFYGGSGSLARNYHRFFDYPSYNPVSVGFLQHLAFFEEAPFSIGNPWGGAKNRVFDRYFMSGYDSAAGIDSTLNPSLRPTSEPRGNPEDGKESAANYTVSGAFNLNSTSVEAWKAAISAVHLYDWEYKIFEEGTFGWTGPERRSHVQNAVFRFPHHGDRTFTHPHVDNVQNYPEVSQEVKETWYKEKWQPDWSAAFTTGIRELRGGYDTSGIYSSGDAIDDVEELATEIVALLRNRGAPYLSFEELLTERADPTDSSSLPLLQEAIDRTRINTVSENNYKNEPSNLERFPRYAASFVTQADLMNVLAPFAQVRGDTFIIRAAGITADPLTNNSQVVYCEALVQRTIVPASGDNPSIDELKDPSSPMGRRFEIVDFRWLPKEEI